MVLIINAEIFLRGSNLCGESRTWQVLLVSKKENGETVHFSEVIKPQFGKNAIHCFVF